MENTLRLLLNFIKHEVLGDSMPTLELDEARAKRLYQLAKAHDLSHLCDPTDVTMPDEIAAKFRKQTMIAVYRYERTNSEYERICDALEAAQIPFLPLKGALIRAYYPAA